MREDLMTVDAPVQSIPNEPVHKPSRWTPEFSFNAIIEWYCGECHKIVYYSCWNATYCPHCNAPIFNYPRRKLDGPQYRGWSYDDQHRMKYDGPTDRSQAKHKSHPGQRPGKTSKGHRRESSQPTESL